MHMHIKGGDLASSTKLLGILSGANKKFLQIGKLIIIELSLIEQNMLKLWSEITNFMRRQCCAYSDTKLVWFISPLLIVCITCVKKPGLVRDFLSPCRNYRQTCYNNIGHCLRMLIVI